MLDVVASERRREILSLLKGRPRSLKEISRSLSLSPPVALKHLRKLEEAGLVERTDEGFEITHLGELFLLAIDRFMKFVEFFSRDPEFWSRHDLSGIPEDLRLRLPELGRYEIIRNEGAEVLKHFRVFSSIYTRSKLVRLVAAVMFPEHPKMFVNIAKRSDVEVVITEKILRAVKENYESELREYLRAGGKLYVCDGVKLTVIATERALCMGLFLRNGVYDTGCGLISYDRSAIRWGLELFERFKERSEECRLVF